MANNMMNMGQAPGPIPVQPPLVVPVLLPYQNHPRFNLPPLVEHHFLQDPGMKYVLEIPVHQGDPFLVHTQMKAGTVCNIL